MAVDSCEGLGEICDFAPVGLVSMDEQGIIVKANTAAADIFGDAPSALIHRPFNLFIPESEQDDFVAYLKEVFRSKTPVSCDLNLHHRKGGEIIVHLLSLAISEGPFKNLCLTAFMEISEPRKQGTLLHLHNQILRNMEEGVVLVRKRDGVIVGANSRFERMFGYASGELNGQPISVLQSSSNPSAQNPKEILNTLDGLGEWKGEFHNVRKDGSLFWTHSSMVSFVHPKYGPVCLSIEQDITERKEAQKNLIEREAQLHTVLDALPANIAVLDAKGRIVAVNGNWTRFAQENGGAHLLTDGLGVDYIAVCQAAERSGEETAGAAARGIASVLMHRQRSFQMEYPCHSPVKERWFSLSVTPLASPLGGAVVAHFDISERKRLELEANRHRETIALALRRNSVHVLTADIAHELMQPLTAILYYSHVIQTLLAETEESKPMTASLQYLERIESQTRRATKIIEHLRDFMRGVPDSRSWLRVDGMLQEALELIRPTMTHKGIRLNLKCPADLPQIWGDRIQLQQVVINLVQNSIEAIESAQRTEGTITISAALAQAGIGISVEDSGPGISSEWAERMFDLFESSKDHGMGFGLAICRAIVKAHGGRLWVDRERMQGTVFHFVLPLAGGIHAP